MLPLGQGQGQGLGQGPDQGNCPSSAAGVQYQGEGVVHHLTLHLSLPHNGIRELACHGETASGGQDTRYGQFLNVPVPVITHRNLKLSVPSTRGFQAFEPS